MGNTLNLDYVTDTKMAQPLENEYAEVTYFDPSHDRYSFYFVDLLTQNLSQSIPQVTLSMFLQSDARLAKTICSLKCLSNLEQLKGSRYFLAVQRKTWL